MYECHITIEPIFDERRLRHAALIATKFGFKIADLYMTKNEGKRSINDTFMTGHDRSDYERLYDRAYDLVKELHASDFEVWRVKIERIVFDTKYSEADRKVMKYVPPAESRTKYKQSDRFVGKLKQLAAGYGTQTGRTESSVNVGNAPSDPYHAAAQFIYATGDVNAIPDDDRRYEIVDTPCEPSSSSSDYPSSSDSGGSSDSGSCGGGE